jgi:hypothetical protein
MHPLSVRAQVVAFRVAAENLATDKDIDEINKEREERCKEEWELETAMRRDNLRRQPAGKKPTWK